MFEQEGVYGFIPHGIGNRMDVARRLYRRFMDNLICQDKPVS